LSFTPKQTYANLYHFQPLFTTILHKYELLSIKSPMGATNRSTSSG
jgi:hypothetical protein